MQAAEAASHGRSGAAHAVVFDRQYEAVVGRRGYNTRGFSVRVFGHVFSASATTKYAADSTDGG